MSVAGCRRRVKPSTTRAAGVRAVAGVVRSPVLVHALAERQISRRVDTSVPPRARTVALNVTKPGRSCRRAILAAVSHSPAEAVSGYGSSLPVASLCVIMTPMRARSGREPEGAADRPAVGPVPGRTVPDAWPATALPAGTRVRVIKDNDWNGPWMREFFGVIDVAPAPEPVRHPLTRPGELAYWVTFEEPQLDGDGAGPYRKALIWGRYLQPVPGDQV